MYDGQLAVYLNFQNTNGKWQTVKIAAVKMNNTHWNLTLPISFIQYISTPLTHYGYANVSFTFQPNDNHGNWQIDDMYVDPCKSH
jgi:ABC-type transporter MlaC component